MYLRAVTMRAISNVEGIHQQAWHWDGTTECLVAFRFGWHVEWLDCHHWHFLWKKKQGVSIKLIDGEVRLFCWTTSWDIWAMGARFPDCFMYHNICPTRMYMALWNDGKSQVYTWSLGRALHAILHFRKRYSSCPTLGVVKQSQRYLSK